MSCREKMSGYLLNKIFFWELLGLSSRMALNLEALCSAVNSLLWDLKLGIFREPTELWNCVLTYLAKTSVCYVFGPSDTSYHR